MTPSLFDLPIRTGEAAALANLVIEVLAEKPVTDDLRNRVAARSGALRLESITPYCGSLERDPIHPSAIYGAIDGLDAQPLLLRMAPATTPSSGLFPKSILIGRVPGPKGQELVINALPFAHSDQDAVRTFAEQVNTAFLPRPQGNRSTIVAVSAAPEKTLPAAFEAFRAVWKERSVNLAGVGDFYAGAWAAIRAGWREGYTAAGTSPLCSQFSGASEQAFDAVREAKSARKTARGFDFCLEVDAVESVPGVLQAWRESGRFLQLVKAPVGSPEQLVEMVNAARAFHAVVAIEGPPPVSGLRLNCRIAIDSGVEEITAAAQLLSL